jgi:hypothetical protein
MKKRFLRSITFGVLSLSVLLLMGSCSQESEDHRAISDSITFFSSFDNGFNADYAKGDPTFYLAPSWSKRENYVPFTDQTDHVKIHENEGRYRHALRIENGYSPVYFYKGDQNIDYQEENWNGSVSFWLKLDPEADLAHGYSDPIQITTSSWNDGSLYVDFTNEQPRRFRFAFFPDREIWDPEERDWEDVPVDEWPMVVLGDMPFSNDGWTFIAFSFRNYNTGEPNAVIDCFIQGEYIGSLENNEQTITWNPKEIAIWLGYNFRGYIDELAIYNRDLSQNEIKNIFELQDGLNSILQTDR